MYLPWFDIEVTHQFFTSGTHRTFTVSPTVRTEARAAQLGVSSQPTPDGIRVLYEARRLAASRRGASNPQTALPLGFKLDTPDHLFAR
jgi:hypothetical protein